PAGSQLLLHMPVADNVLPFSKAAFRQERCLWLSRAWLVCLRGIGQYERVFSFFMFEEIEDSFLLHKPRNELKICLAVLNTVVPFGIRQIEFISKVAQAEVFERILDDFGYRLVLMNEALRIPGKEPQPWDHLSLIMR